MDRDKLNKAAEEARITTAISARSDWHHSLDGVKLDVSIDELVESFFVGGADWLMQQPISERLTDAEIAKARAAYRRAEECYNNNADDMSYAAGLVVKTVLKEIFGADLFK